MPRNVLYMAVTADDLELPLYATPYILELAEKTGVSDGNIATYITKKKNGARLGFKFLKVNMEDADE